MPRATSLGGGCLSGLVLGLLLCGNAAASPKKAWLVAVYMAADNDLGPEAIRDLAELRGQGESSRLDVVVFLDTPEPDGLRYYHLPEERPEVLLPEGDSGDARTAGEFLRWAREHYPAERTFFLGWGHGEGYEARWSPRRRGGFAFDDTSRSQMAVNQLAAELRRAPPVDILGSESCNNQQLEVGYEWLGLVGYFFGAVGTLPRKGFDYRELLRWLDGNATEPTQRIARELPRLYGRSVVLPSEDVPIAVASVEVARLVPLRERTEALAERLTAWIDEAPTRVGRIAREEALRRLLVAVPRPGGLSSDLGAFLGALVRFEDPEARRRARKAEDALKEAVTEAWTHRLGSLGVAVWLPTTAVDFESRIPAYRISRFYRDGARSWAGWIDRIAPR